MMPREKLFALGESALTDEELLAILLRTGTNRLSVLPLARDLLHRFNGLPGLARTDSAELIQRCSGIGLAKAVTLTAAFSAGRRALVQRHSLAACKRSEEAAAFLVPKLGCMLQEEFHALYLDSRKQVIRQALISRGTLRQSLVHPSDVFRPAIAAAADSIILAHNHPSGDPTPSQADFDTTRRLCEAGRQLCLQIIDHIVVGGDRWVSLRDLDDSLFAGFIL